MIDIRQAEALISATLPTAQLETIAIENAHGRCLAQTVTADRDQPPFDRVTMDGIALASARVAAGQTRFTIAGTQAAGAVPVALADASHCLEVMTGAVLPPGCDCVVPVEEITVADSVATLCEPGCCEPWRFVHQRGTDYPAGQRLLESGAQLRSPELAVLAAVGLATVNVRRLPRICVISTGDELVEPGMAVAPQQIRMSNDYAIFGRLAGRGLPALSRQHLMDNPVELTAALARLLEENDMLILSGGVSRGKFDYLPQVFADLGVTRIFHRVAQKPGKPLWFGQGPDGQCVFALPGNPVSALVCFTRYVIPALDRLNGLEPVTRSVALGETMSFSNNLARLVPVTLDGQVAWPRELNTSGDFFGLAGTDGFCELKPTPRLWKAGSTVSFYPW